MYPEQTAVMIELLRATDVFSGELSNGAKAQIWRNITERCNGMRGARKRTVDQYKRHWYDLKMKVKNKLLRRQEAYSIPGTVTIPEHMELTEDEQYVATFVKNMDGMEEIVEEALGEVKASRTRDQTAMLLKLVHINKDNFKKKSMAERQRIWRDIAKTLNDMPGPEKTVDGWKKAYWSWRLQAGEDYDKEVQRWIQKAPTLTDNNSEPCNDQIVDVQRIKKCSSEDELPEVEVPSKEQEKRLHELIKENQALLVSGRSDDPLKKQIWINIANELNSISGGITLDAHEWRKRSGFKQFSVKTESRPSQDFKSNQNTSKTKHLSEVISLGPEDVDNVEFEIMDSSLGMDDTLHNMEEDSLLRNEFVADDTNDCVYEEHELDQHTEDYESDHEFLYTDNDLNDENPQSQIGIAGIGEEDPAEYKPKPKRLKVTPPIVKSFKFNNRIVDAVEKISSDVKDLKEVLMQTANSLASLEEIMERQNETQNETNNLLKRNNQLLKILVEYKTGRRSNTGN